MKKRFSEEQIIGFLQQVEAGIPIKELCRQHGFSDGSFYNWLTIVDDFSKEAIDLAVDFGISGHYVTRVLNQATRFRGSPKEIRTDQGPEFTGKALDQWAYQHGVQLKLIRVGNV